jgi:hypothetical protein
VFAEATKRDYLPVMAFRFHHRLIGIATAVLFCFSIVGHGFAMSEMSAKMVMANSAVDMSQDACAGCDENPMTMHAACIALCASSVAILSDPVELLIMTVGREVNPAATRFLPGRDRPPEPYPPRLILVS